jgi:hypothetical protein
VSLYLRWAAISAVAAVAVGAGEVGDVGDVGDVGILTRRRGDAERFRSRRFFLRVLRVSA